MAAKGTGSPHRARFRRYFAAVQESTDAPDVPVASPFLKWAGGKSQLVAPILARIPIRIETYHEPFIGGGAVFFALAAQRRFRRAVLSDRNQDLIDVYTTVRDHVDALITVLSQHRYEAEYFYALRARDPSEMDLVERAARILYLNRTCFNGLYRVNRRGQFNVPFGRYTNPRICDAEGLRLASAALADVSLIVQDFERAVEDARPGDAVYFDPPYAPVSATSSFTAYDPFPFREGEHERLAKVHRALGERGVFSLLSNSDTPFTRALYDGLEVETVEAVRAINSKISKRGKITELLVTARPRA
jgi:DNA adenine methylase